MSFLFAVCIPGLLMFSTYGLQRLEDVVHSERPTAGDIVARIEQAARAARDKAIANGVVVSPTVRAAPPEPLHRLLDDEPRLPTRTDLRTQPNPQFQSSKYVNSV